MASRLPQLKKRKVVEKNLHQLMSELEDIDTPRETQTVPDLEVAEIQKRKSLVPKIGLDDRLFTEKELTDPGAVLKPRKDVKDLNRKLVPAETAVSGRLYSV